MLGEGESVWSDVISDLLTFGEVRKCLYDGRTLTFNLSHAPIPRYDLLDVTRYNRLTVQTQRGCPFRCRILCCVTSDFTAL